MYRIIENGEEKIVSAEEAEIIIANFYKRNNKAALALDETWRTLKTIYLDDEI